MTTCAIDWILKQQLCREFYFYKFIIYSVFNCQKCDNSIHVFIIEVKVGRGGQYKTRWF